MRINRFLAQNLGISRRQADTWVQNQLVKINSDFAKLYNHVDVETDQVEIFIEQKWQLLTVQNKMQTLLFFKPIFCITSRKDPQKRKTIYDFLPQKYYNFKPAGRLDYMSEGLLVLSQDGDLIQRLTHPKSGHQKKYLVALKHNLNQDFIEHLKTGVKLDNYQTNPVKVSLFQNFEKFDYLKLNPKQFWYEFELTEGRQNQIRRLAEVGGTKVLRLIRTSQAEFTISKDLYQKKHILV